MGEKTWVKKTRVKKDGGKKHEENFVKSMGEKRWVKKKHG